MAEVSRVTRRRTSELSRGQRRGGPCSPHPWHSLRTRLRHRGQRPSLPALPCPPVLPARRVAPLRPPGRRRVGDDRPGASDVPRVRRRASPFQSCAARSPARPPRRGRHRRPRPRQLHRPPRVGGRSGRHDQHPDLHGGRGLPAAVAPMAHRVARPGMGGVGPRGLVASRPALGPVRLRPRLRVGPGSDCPQRASPHRRAAGGF